MSKNNFILLLLALMLPGFTNAYNPPVADFFAVPTSGWDIYHRPEFVSLSTGEITSHFWDFGDDSTSIELTPNHKYAQPGVYTVTLIVSGPGGADTLRKEDYITVKDFATEYSYPDYVIEEPTMAAWDSVMDAIQASQLNGSNPGDPVWWDDPNEIKHGGGGRILFGFSNDTIFVDHHRDFFGDNLIVDGEDKAVYFYYNGPDSCDQTEGRDALVRMHGNDNIFRNVNFDRFPDGVHLRGGQRGLIENVTVNIICEDAMTMNGGGYKVIDCIIRDCSYQWSEDKTIMVNSGLGDMVISGCYSCDGNQPIRMTGAGLMVVRNCEFTGSRNNGPRFGGKENLVVFENNYSHGTKSGLRLSDEVSAIVRNNIIENCLQFGIRTQSTKDILARIENNIITGNTNGVYLLDNNVQMDLGGGSLNIHRHHKHSGPGTTPIPSVGGNTITGNMPCDVNNKSSRTVKAENNVWDHKTVAEVLANDVNGDVDVDPLHPLSSVSEPGLKEIPEDYVLLENFPNPFNTSVTIRYYLPKTSHVIIEIFDGLGKKMRRLVDGKKEKGYGQVNWDGFDENGAAVSSGVYHIRLIAISEGTTIERSSVITKALLVK